MYLRFDRATENIIGAIRAGFGGEYEDGALCDRRLHPFTKPLKANPELGIPEPKEVYSFSEDGGSVTITRMERDEQPNYVCVPILMLQSLINLSGAPDKGMYEKLIPDARRDTERDGTPYAGSDIII